MTHGTTYHHWSCTNWGRNPFHVQKKQNTRDNRSWGSYSKYRHTLSEHRGDPDIIYEVVPLINGMERGLFKRGITRREYQICVLETRYPCKKRTHIAKLTKPAKRKYENGRCFSSGSILRDKQTSNESDTIITIESRTKRLCLRDRPVINDSLCAKVFHGVGSDLIAPWLTPSDMYSVKQAFACDWNWGQTWHGGKVKDKSVAAQLVVLVSQGKSIDQNILCFGADKVFSALWYILPCHLFVLHAHRLKHWKSIRKLDRLI
jgi:hypothetical protein